MDIPLNRFPGWKKTPRAHWVCFVCRKMFRKMERPASNSAALCPQCRQPMTDMGPYFETPKHSNRRLWVLLQDLAGAGYRFNNEGSRSFFFGKTKGRTPSTRAAMLRIKKFLTDEL